jgi:hypothetical protein
MNTKNIVKGLQILQKYMKDKEGYNISAEHDVIYFHVTDYPIPNSDLEELVNLGWFQENAEYEDEFTIWSYDPASGWTCYV